MDAPFSIIVYSTHTFKLYDASTSKQHIWFDERSYDTWWWTTLRTVEFWYKFSNMVYFPIIFPHITMTKFAPSIKNESLNNSKAFQGLAKNTLKLGLGWVIKSYFPRENIITYPCPEIQWPWEVHWKERGLGEGWGHLAGDTARFIDKHMTICHVYLHMKKCHAFIYLG